MPTATTGQEVTIPLAIGSQFSAGDPSTQPADTTRTFRNYVARPNRFDGRPPFIYDSLAAANGYFRYEDLAGGLTRTMAWDNGGSLYYKTAGTGFGWTTVGTSYGAAITQTRVSDYANLLGKVYFMVENDSSVPSGALSYDGGTPSKTPFNSAIFSRTVTSFVDRLFLGHPRVTVTPQFQNGGNAYDIGVTDVLRWKLSGCTGQNIVASGVTICRLYLTSTTAAQFYYQRTGIVAANLGIVNVAASGQSQSVVFRSDLRHNHPTQRLPITLEVYVATRWWNNGGGGQAYALGDIISDGAGHLLRCTTGGTGGAGVEPVWATTVGATTNDGTAVWTAEGSDIVGSVEDSVLPVNDSNDFSTYWVSGICPARTNIVNLSVRCKFFNSITTTIALCAVDVSLKDGIADGDARKQNYGQQVTLGEFEYPFVNTETATTSTRDLEDLIWSENGQPSRILASNTWKLGEVAGLVTGACLLGGRMMVFKRRGFWQFARTESNDIPILPEIPASVGIGCVGPQALDVYDDEVFFVGENEVYRMKLGEAPRPMCGPGMREEVMAHGANWVEKQSSSNRALLAVDQANNDVWVYTQKDKVFVFNLETGTWSTIDIATTNPAQHTFAAMIFDTIGQRMCAAIGDGTAIGGSNATRLTETVSTADTFEAAGTLYSITNDIVFKPIELFSPRFQLSVRQVDLYHNATASQTGNTLTMSYSLDRGTTWNIPADILSGNPLYPITINVNDPMIPMPLYAMGNSVTIKLSRTGQGGAAKWSISKANVTVRVESGQYPYVNAA